MAHCFIWRLKKILYILLIIPFVDRSNAEVLLDHGYYRTRGRRRVRTKRGGKKRRNKFARARRGGNWSAIFARLTDNCRRNCFPLYFVPSFCSSFLHFLWLVSPFFLSIVLFPFTFFLTISDHLLRFYSYSPCYIFKSVASPVYREGILTIRRINIEYRMNAEPLNDTCSESMQNNFKLLRIFSEFLIYIYYESFHKHINLGESSISNYSDF